ncbi:sensor histidine kinase [Burkholderia lata]|uniref:Sensor histidine kinase n=1 Tax=Burkholderia lata (strain ATCC 17760 / DSM 23089 / LMG 22485 / NCIMB 9086 / R18194 / 383) TaxID=482957 RepID=A0A6P2Y9G6_BURL3|nr:CHASE domain-containing protein [Burkholderia lata]VWD18593.1 sensor histidine kinase [Burkholderia lata]
MIRRASRHPLAIAAIVLMLLLGVTHLVVVQLDARARAAADLKFGEFVTDTSNKIQVQLLRYVDVLSGVRGLWSVVGEPTQQQFREYVASLHVAQRFPALETVNYCDYVATADTGRYEQAMRTLLRDPGFTVFPAVTTHPFRTVVRYNEPHKAIYQGRDIAAHFDWNIATGTNLSGEPYTSGLGVTQLEHGNGPGLGIRLTVYRGGELPPPAERAARAIGSAGIFVDVRSLIREAMPGEDWQFVSLRLHTVAKPGESRDVRRRELYAFDNPALAGKTTTTERRTFVVAGRPFVLDIAVPAGHFQDVIGRHLRAIGYALGSAISLASAFIIYLLLVSQRRLSDTVTQQSVSLASTQHQVSTLLDAQLRAERELTRQGERERQQIGRELHDDLGQKLTGASLMLSTLAQSRRDGADDPQQVIDKVSAIVEDGIETIRTLSRGLSPFDGSPHDLAAALRELCGDVDRIAAGGCHLSVEYDTELLSPDASLHLYRIVQESISNALRHGRATRIDVALRDIDGRVALSIHDNGAGFAPGVDPAAQPASRLGLRSIRSRAQLLGLQARFLTNETGGMTVEVN